MLCDFATPPSELSSRFRCATVETRSNATAVMSALKKLVNEYLFHEFGVEEVEEDRERISENWPFALSELSSILASGHQWELFRFTHEGEDFFAVANGGMNFFPVAGMEIDDVALQMVGARWIGSNEPIDLATVCGTESNVPRVAERRGKIQELAARVTGGAEPV